MWFVLIKKEIYGLKRKRFPCKNLVRVINSTIDSTCVSCNERKGICLDENSDGYMDKCFCQPNNDLCHGRASTPSIQETEPVKNKYESMRCFFQ